MAIKHRITAGPSKKSYMSWADMQKAIQTVVNELKAKGLKIWPDGQWHKSPSCVLRTYSAKDTTRAGVLKLLKDRGFTQDRLGTIGKRVGSLAVAIDIGEQGFGVNMDISVTDFAGPQEDDIGPGSSGYYGD